MLSIRLIIVLLGILPVATQTFTTSIYKYPSSKNGTGLHVDCLPPHVLSKRYQAAVVDTSIKVIPLLGHKRFLIFLVSMESAPNRLSIDSINSITKTVSDYFSANSNGAMQASFNLHPSRWVAPDSFSTHIWDWINPKIASAGLRSPENYDFAIVQYSVRALNRADLGGNAYITGWTPGVLVHELGNSFGLQHALGVEAGTEILGDPDTDTTMSAKDSFDPIGDDRSIKAHYNTIYKYQLGWLNAAEIVTGTSSGIYRLYTHDQATRAPGKILAIRVPSGNPKLTYWLEYRTGGPGEGVIGNGIAPKRKGFIIRVERYFHKNGVPRPYSVLLDMRPNTPNEFWDFADAGPDLYEPAFSEKFGGPSIQVVGQNPRVWNQDGWVDVEIKYSNPEINLPISKQGWKKQKRQNHDPIKMNLRFNDKS